MCYSSIGRVALFISLNDFQKQTKKGIRAEKFFSLVVNFFKAIDSLLVKGVREEELWIHSFCWNSIMNRQK